MASSFDSTLLHHFLAFFDQPHHALAGFGPCSHAQKRETLVDALDLLLRFQEMLLEQFAKLVETGGLRHFWQRFGQLFFGMKDVAQFIDQQLVQALWRYRRGTFGLDGYGCCSTRLLLKGRRLDEFPIAAFIPRASGVDLALVSDARRSR